MRPLYLPVGVIVLGSPLHAWLGGFYGVAAARTPAAVSPHSAVSLVPPIMSYHAMLLDAVTHRLIVGWVGLVSTGLLSSMCVSINQVPPSWKESCQVQRSSPISSRCPSLHSLPSSSIPLPSFPFTSQPLP